MNFLVLGGAIAIIAINQLVLRVAALRQSPWVFWGVQFVNLGVACALIWWTLPGFGAYGKLISGVLALMLVFRIIQNNMTRSKFLRRAIDEDRAEEKRIRAQRLALQVEEEELEQRRAAESEGPEAAALDPETSP
ncbi:MAG: hypothetical protein AB8H79_06470 [Myxococcota bacterium]